MKDLGLLIFGVVYMGLFILSIFLILKDRKRAIDIQSELDILEKRIKSGDDYNSIRSDFEIFCENSPIAFGTKRRLREIGKMIEVKYNVTIFED